MPRHDVLEGIPAQLWRTVALARRRLLMLDYDGTLAPFVVERQEAQPSPRVLELLRAAATRTRTSLAIVSGRPLVELEDLVGTVPAILVGEHGWERRAPDGVITSRPLEPSAAAAIDAAERLAHANGWGGYLERKRSAVVLHTRALPADRARELETACLEAWSKLSGGSHVALDRMDGGVELRACDRNKGTVVLSLITQTPPGTLGVFVGDDVSDEDAFDAVQEWGFGVRVGDESRPSLAQGRLASCAAVPEFLEEWLRVAEVREARGANGHGV